MMICFGLFGIGSKNDIELEVLNGYILAIGKNPLREDGFFPLIKIL